MLLLLFNSGSVPKPSTTDIVITGSSVSRSDSGIATQDTNIDEEEDERRMSMRGPTVEPKQENNQESNVSYYRFNYKIIITFWHNYNLTITAYHVYLNEHKVIVIYV